MEKVLYVLAEPAAASAAERAALFDQLASAGGRGIALSLDDDAVARGAGLRIASTERPAAGVLSVWVDSATDHLRAPIDAVVADLGVDHAAYLVTESVPLPGPAGSISPGAATDGFVQVAFLRRRPDLTELEWLHTWLDDHTHVAIDLQDTFRYVQHVVTRVLTPGAEPWDAIVEEGFPATALDDPHAFFDTHGDAGLLAERQQAMFASVQRFLDLSRIDVVPTSRWSADG